MLAKAATPQVEFVIDGNKWTMIQSGLRDNTASFELGVEKDHETADGRKTKVPYTPFQSIYIEMINLFQLIYLYT